MRVRILTALLCAVALAGCGNKEAMTTEAETEGIWVDVGPLDYHIQGSRQLNPFAVPDDRYVTGLPEGEEEISVEETWFAVFLRIENKTGDAALTAEKIEIEDTKGELYEAVEVDVAENPYAYFPQELGARDAMPHPDSSQELDSTAGAMVLFKLPLESYQNRPLELLIHAPEGSEGPEEASLVLDV